MERSNFLFIFSDQQHWRAVGYRDPFFETPAQDALSRESTIFENAFCSTPQCSPSRSSMLTGLYPSKTSVIGNIGNAGGNPLPMPTIGKTLQEVGYATGYFGKWHLGPDPRGTSGWDEKWLQQVDGLATRKAKKYLKKSAKSRRETGKPFALFVSYRNPHDIYRFLTHRMRKQPDDVPLPDTWKDPSFESHPIVHEQFMTEDQGRRIHDKDEETWKRYRDCYRAKNKKYDAHVGRLIRALKRSGEWDNTVVIVTSDHGDMDANHRLVFKGPFMYEHLQRIPLLVRVPEQFGGKVGHVKTDFETINTDLVPTILDFAGVNLEGRNFDGFSLKPLLTRENDPLPQREFIVIQYYSKQKWVNPIRTIRTTCYKYNLYLPTGEELYDLECDPEEQVNQWSNPEYQIIKDELKEKLDQWIKANGDPFYSQVATDRGGHPL